MIIKDQSTLVGGISFLQKNFSSKEEAIRVK
jgi:hypothetical protein